MQLSRTDNHYIALWLLASLFAYLVALGMLSAASVDGVFIPVGNDSLYHARRILDVAVEGMPLYDFDSRIHVPEGSQILWPWGYDYLMAQFVKLGLLIAPGAEPMKLLAYIPALWVLVNIALFLALVRRCGLDLPLAVPASLGFAILPLNQLLHGVGIVDHHFMELTFVLLVAWSSIRFIDAPTRGSAVLLGLSLGIAPAMHTSLFLLQLPVLAGFVLIWFRGQLPSVEQLAPMMIALVLASIAVALPSEPFRQFAFDFATLSIFHVYVAACSGILLLTLTGLAPQGKGPVIAAAVAVVLAVPLITQGVIGANYIAADQVGLGDIAETRSPFEILARSDSHVGLTRYYSFLIFVAPVMIAVFAWLAWTAKTASQIMRNVAIVFGAAMLLTQFRFHPFGAWALLLAPAILFQAYASRAGLKTSMVAAAAGVGALLIFITPIRYVLFVNYPPGMVINYAIVHPMFDTVTAECEQAPGVMLGVQDDGHAIRYFSDCSVIANNFLLTEQHGDKLVELNRLLEMQPSALTGAEPAVDYVLVHLYGLFRRTPQGPVASTVEDIRGDNPPLFSALALDGDVPPNFQLIRELRLEDERDLPYVQLYRVRRPEP
ncbi:MAG: hypothetical protein AAF660_05130 [Pseudomonadota bacterium]